MTDNIYLQCYDEYNKYACYNVINFNISYYNKEQIAVNKNMVQSGWYSSYSGHLILLYIINGKLILKVNEFHFELCEDIIVDVSGPWDNRTLKIYLKKREVLTIMYTTINRPYDNDITPFIEDDDFDLCLFARNLLMDKERRNRVINIKRYI